MTTEEEKRKRQEKVQIMLAKDPTLTNEDLAEEFDVHSSTIKRDLAEVRERKEEMMEEEPIEMILLEMSTQMKALLKEYWRSYKEFESETSQIGALNGARSLLKDRVKLLQRLGIIREEPRHVKKEIIDKDAEKILEEIEAEAEDLDVFPGDDGESGEMASDKLETDVVGDVGSGDEMDE